MSRCEMVYSVRVDRLLAEFLTGLLNRSLAGLYALCGFVLYR